MSRKRRRMEYDLKKISDVLIPSDEELEDRKTIANTLFEILNRKSKFKIDRIELSCSIEKQIAITMELEFQYIVFINEELPPFKNVIDDFEEILSLEENWNQKVEIYRSLNSIRVTLNHMKLDVIPATNFINDASLQRIHIYKLIKTKRSQDGYKFSSSLSESRAEFIKRQSKLAHSLIRLVKFWKRTLYIKKYSTEILWMLETVAIYVENEEKTSEYYSLLKAFRHFMKLIKNLNNLNVIFEEYYSITDVKDFILRQRPLVLDPSNPCNNLAYPFIHNEEMKILLQEFAETTL
ncbi:2'-5'-oligoadenylate synthase-like protein 2 [Centruroides vittatus]|uniref:2'-5'-oligoadenylate synthase-like protein 2 n=1 Tax=Centruroides vittatus TaxID=120091 RepID=UPI00350FC7CE